MKEKKEFKKSGNKMIKIISATAMTIFSLFAAFMGTMAWFVTTQDSQNDQDQFVVAKQDKRFKQMTLHSYLETANGQYRFAQSASGTFTYNWGSSITSYDGDSLSAFMGEYSLMYQSHPFLALIEFSDVYTTDTDLNRVKLTLSTERDFLGAKDDQGQFKEPLTETSNPLSSIVKFEATTFSTLDSNKTGTTSYNFNIPTSWNHFADITEDNKGNLSFDDEDGWDNTIDLVDVSDGTEVKYIAIIFDYYEDALEYIYNIYLGNSVLEQETVPFQCDCKMVI